PQGQRVRNGFMLNPPARMKVAYDNGVRNWFDPRADPEAARGDETRRFAGLHAQPAQGAGPPCPVAEQDRAWRGRQQPDPGGCGSDLREPAAAAGCVSPG